MLPAPEVGGINWPSLIFWYTFIDVLNSVHKLEFCQRLTWLQSIDCHNKIENKILTFSADWKLNPSNVSLKVSVMIDCWLTMIVKVLITYCLDTEDHQGSRACQSLSLDPSHSLVETSHLYQWLVGTLFHHLQTCARGRGRVPWSCASLPAWRAGTHCCWSSGLVEQLAEWSYWSQSCYENQILKQNSAIFTPLLRTLCFDVFITAPHQ